VCFACWFSSGDQNKRACIRFPSAVLVDERFQQIGVEFATSAARGEISIKHIAAAAAAIRRNRGAAVATA